MKPLNLAPFGLLVLLSLGSGGGCAMPPKPLAAATRASIQARVTEVFPRAILVKPIDAGFDQPLLVQLAPLLIFAADQRPAPTNLEISARASITLLHNRWYRQFTYTWNTSSPRTDTTLTQGVRITLNSSDAPVIWEILRDSSGAEIIYAADSLEFAARTEFGLPQPGHKFALERAFPENPSLVLANVISDGPVAMGPILYLRGETLDVTALICRCMPAQFTDLAATREYLLRPIPPTAPLADPGFSPKPLDQRLRLPRQF